VVGKGGNEKVRDRGKKPGGLPFARMCFGRGLFQSTRIPEGDREGREGGGRTQPWAPGSQSRDRAYSGHGGRGRGIKRRSYGRGLAVSLYTSSMCRLRALGDPKGNRGSKGGRRDLRQGKKGKGMKPKSGGGRHRSQGRTSAARVPPKKKKKEEQGERSNIRDRLGEFSASFS